MCQLAVCFLMVRCFRWKFLDQFWWNLGGAYLILNFFSGLGLIALSSPDFIPKSSWNCQFLENQLLLISINFTPKTSLSCLKKWYFPSLGFPGLDFFLSWFLPPPFWAVCCFFCATCFGSDGVPLVSLLGGRIFHLPDIATRLPYSAVRRSIHEDEKRTTAMKWDQTLYGGCVGDNDYNDWCPNVKNPCRLKYLLHFWVVFFYLDERWNFPFRKNLNHFWEDRALDGLGLPVS